MADRKRATTAKLEPGENSIMRVAASTTEDGTVVIHWRLALHNGHVVKKTSKGPTLGIARRRAKATAKRLLETPGNENWTPNSPVLDYMEMVTLPAIKKLDANSSRRYQQAYRHLRGECHDKDCTHKHSMAGLSVYNAMRPRNLKDCLEEIGRLHGPSNVKHARTIMNLYVAEQMRIDELIEFNPVPGLRLDLSEAKKPLVQRGGQALTVEQYRKVMAYLLTLDPTDAPQPTRGRWIGEVQVVQRANAIDLVLAQMTTGMRTSELAMRPVDMCEIDADGTFILWLPDADVKNRKGRPVPVIDPVISARLAERLSAAKGPFLFGAPEDPTKAWQPRTRDRKVAELYKELSTELEIPMFESERGHSWRTTLNTLLYDELSEATRVRLLGHTEPVNRHHYTAVTPTKAVVEAAAKVLREK